MGWIEDLIIKYSTLEPLNLKLSKIDTAFSNGYYNDVVDMSKSLVEGILRTILNERNIIFKSSEDLEKLFGLFYKNIKYFEENEIDLFHRFKSSLINILNALREFRNCQGEIGHGKDISHKETKEELAKFIFENSKTFIAFLWSIHKNYDETKRTLVYDEHIEFNDWFDEQNKEDVKIENYDYTFLPSQVLFLDQEAYRSELNIYNLDIVYMGQKKSLIENFSKSHNFDQTHNYIKELSAFFNLFNNEDFEKIISVTLENDQINWILGDEDLQEFFKKLLNLNQEITNETLENYLKYLGGDLSIHMRG